MDSNQRTGEAMFEYSGSTALVTGASKGLGAAFAEALAERGMKLVLVARSTVELNALSTRLYAKYKVHRTVLSIDLADPSSPHREVSMVWRCFCARPDGGRDRVSQSCALG